MALRTAPPSSTSRPQIREPDPCTQETQEARHHEGSRILAHRQGPPRHPSKINPGRESHKRDGPKRLRRCDLNIHTHMVCVTCLPKQSLFSHPNPNPRKHTIPTAQNNPHPQNSFNHVWVDAVVTEIASLLIFRRQLPESHTPTIRPLGRGALGFKTSLGPT